MSDESDLAAELQNAWERDLAAELCDLRKTVRRHAVILGEVAQFINGVQRFEASQARLQRSVDRLQADLRALKEATDVRQDSDDVDARPGDAESDADS